MLCTVILAVFREIRTLFPPASLGCIAYDHWGPYTLHTFKLNTEELKTPHDCRLPGIYEYVLVKFYAVAAQVTHPESHGPLCKENITLLTADN